MYHYFIVYENDASMKRFAHADSFLKCIKLMMTENRAFTAVKFTVGYGATEHYSYGQ